MTSECDSVELLGQHVIGVLVVFQKIISMKIEELKNKIPEVHAAARIIVQEYGHTKKFAKHIIALVVKQIKHLTDIELVEFIGTDKIGKMLGYKIMPTSSTFSKVRERSDPNILRDLNSWILQDRFKGRQVRLLAPDNTDLTPPTTT